MYCRFLLITLILLCGIAFPENLFGYWIWTPETSRWINPKYYIKDTPREQFEWAESFAKDGDLDMAIKKHEQLIKCYPTSSYAATSQYRIGELYLEKGNRSEAFWAFQKVIENYPRTSLIDKIVAKEFEIANSFFDRKRKRFAKIPIPTSVKTAELFEKIVENEPFGKYAAESQYKSGLSYLREKDWERAKDALQKVVDNYSESKWAEEASYQIIWFSLKKSPKIATDLTSLEETIDKCKEFKRTFPESKRGKATERIIEDAHRRKAEKLYQIGLFYEKRRERKAALIYYEKTIRLYPETEAAKTAEERLKKLK